MNALRAGRLDHLHRLHAKEGHAGQVSAHLRLGVRLLRIAVLCLELGLGFRFDPGLASIGGRAIDLARPFDYLSPLKIAGLRASESDVL